jgi:serine/threonine protein kinase
MSLNSGTRLGPYEIVSAIGAGGMGEVYRGHDSKLNRDVALKTRPHAFATDHVRPLGATEAASSPRLTVSITSLVSPPGLAS